MNTNTNKRILTIIVRIVAFFTIEVKHGSANAKHGTIRQHVFMAFYNRTYPAGSAFAFANPQWVC
jgi:hypothetical protein